MQITRIGPPDARTPVAANYLLNIYADEPCHVTGPGPIRVSMRSADPSLHDDLLFDYQPIYSDLPTGLIGFLTAADLTGCAGLRFTLDAACTFVNWNQVSSLDGDPLPTDLSGQTGSFIVGVFGDLIATVAPATLHAAGTVAGPRPLDGGSGIDNALLAKLGADPTLLSLCPNGVHWNLAPDGSRKFVVVSLVDAHDEPEFGGTAWEEMLYAIEARMVAREGEVTSIHAAADRIHTLLQDQALTVPGYDCIAMHREVGGTARIRMTDFDANDPGVRWYRRGGYYRVIMANQRN